MKKIKKIVYLTILMIFVSTSLPDAHVFAKITTCTTQTVSMIISKRREVNGIHTVRLGLQITGK